MKIPFNKEEQKVAEDLLKKKMFLVKYYSQGENRFAIYKKDPSQLKNLIDDSIMIDTGGSISDLLFELKLIFRAFDQDEDQDENLNEDFDEDQDENLIEDFDEDQDENLIEDFDENQDKELDEDQEIVLLDETMKIVNGLYYFQDKQYFSLIRFYEDRTVIGQNVSASLDEIPIVLTWFNKESSKCNNIGVYEITDDFRVLFVLKSENGLVDYKGRIINTNKIIFQIHSHINDYKHEETYLRYQHEIYS